MNVNYGMTIDRLITAHLYLNDNSNHIDYDYPFAENVRFCTTCFSSTVYCAPCSITKQSTMCYVYTTSSSRQYCPIYFYMMYQKHDWASTKTTISTICLNTTAKTNYTVYTMRRDYVTTVLHTAKWQLSAISQPTRPTQPAIPPGPVKWVVIH